METRIALLDEKQWEYVDASLENGVGLSGACEGMHIDVQAMSEFLNSHPKFRSRLQGQCTAGYKALVTIINNHAADQNAGKWREGHRALREFVKTINLWEQHCPRADVSPDKVAEAFYIYHYPQEVATVLGFTLREFYPFILANQNLNSYLLQNKFIN